MSQHLHRSLGFAITFSLVFAAKAQQESLIHSFTGYFESVHGTISYYPATVHWSYLYKEDGASIRGLRLDLPHEETSTDYEISELWGNEKGVIFICGKMTVLLIKEPGAAAANTPLITLSKTSELNLPPSQRSYYQYFALDHSTTPAIVAGVEGGVPDE
ncbi:MAG: hypothetical protein AAGA85_06695 [Bacteroidota bacterium]